MSRVWFITGTDTGVGKTVLTALLVRHLIGQGFRARAVKPLASGGREDARLLHRAQGGALPLDALNPWFFRAPLTPTLAARAEGRRVQRGELLDFLRQARAGTDLLLVEGAGGLLSPLGEGVDARDLIRDLRALPVIVAANRLGAINQVLLVVEALGPRGRSARVALMAPVRPDRVSRGNLDVLRERLGAGRILEVPCFADPEAPRLAPAFRARLAEWCAVASAGASGGRGK